MEQVQPNITHVHGLGNEYRLSLAAKVEPNILSAWGFFNHLVQGKAPLSGSSFPQTQALILESPALVKAMHQHYPGVPRVELIPMGVNTQRFRAGQSGQSMAWRRSLRIPPDAFVLLSPRGWGKIYNHLSILQAFSRARPWFQRQTYLVFTRMGRNSYSGEAERVYAEVMNEARSLGLSDMIRYMPALPFELMPGLYQLADALVNYPSQDAFPSTLIEAAACECPIISARLPSYAGTFVEDCATLVTPGQVDELAEALVRVVNQSPDERFATLKRARAVILDQYDEQRVQCQLYALYRELAVGS
jgi:glycosyltransferase involved in cell wall biosynthesis